MPLLGIGDDKCVRCSGMLEKGSLQLVIGGGKGRWCSSPSACHDQENDADAAADEQKEDKDCTDYECGDLCGTHSRRVNNNRWVTLFCHPVGI